MLEAVLDRGSQLVRKCLQAFLRAPVVQVQRAHGHDDIARELRGAAGRITGNEPAGLYAMQDLLRRLRSLNLDDRSAQERLKTLTSELRTAVQDRFEQLELLPFRRP